MSNALTNPTHSAKIAGFPPAPSEDSPKSNRGAGQGQMGFGFLDDAGPVAALELAVGSWERPGFSRAQYQEKLARAEAGLQCLAGPGRPVFRAGIEGARAYLDASREQGYFTLPCRAIEIEDEALQALVAHCRTFRDWHAQGVRYKVREGGRHDMAGMAVEGVGSVVVTRYDDGRLVASFLPYEDTFFLDSYQDGEPTHELPYAVWGPAISCQKVVEAKDTPAVGSFLFKGREYTCVGASYGAGQRSGWCWLLVAASEWTGATATYRELSQAWDDGRRERGDERGLLVRVRGQLCVLHSPAYFVDRNPVDTFVSLIGDEDDDNQDDELQEDDE